MEHMLFGCTWVRAVWFGSKLNYKVDWCSISSVIHWICAVKETIKSKQVRLAMEERMVALSVLGTTEWSSSFHPNPNLKWSPPPPAGRYKINSDVVFLKSSRGASIAAILWDSQGKILDGLTRSILISSVLQGEAMACRLACQLASSRNPSNLEISGHNKPVISLCVSESIPPWECAAVIDDVQILAQRGDFSFLCNTRTANKATHWMAQSHLQNLLPLDWVSRPLPGIAAYLAHL
ncbi:uncharacterized protein LOC114265052 [Camellia sinensis]|uniref:uncharacterized protein LOC114265052 n=1 Tax=Camellia sinensis TaxID=4442 RepID=UPI0010357782|nr:uncharacterized protein LOC114265052 [Camellia sinensis]